MTNSTALWYASRATGVVALLLLTVVFAGGVLIVRRGRLPGLPRFAVTALHRNLSLLAVSFVAVHVLTAVLDTYVHIPLLSAVIPFASGYERLWLGVGAVAFDLFIAMIVTSLVRGRLNPALWRAVHLTAYLSWPFAFAHSIYSSGDLRHGPLLYLAVACALTLAGAIAWRLLGAARETPRAKRVAAILAAPAAARRPGDAASRREPAR